MIRIWEISNVKILFFQNVTFSSNLIQIFYFRKENHKQQRCQNLAQIVSNPLNYIYVYDSESIIHYYKDFVSILTPKTLLDQSQGFFISGSTQNKKSKSKAKCNRKCRKINKAWKVFALLIDLTIWLNEWRDVKIVLTDIFTEIKGIFKKYFLHTF